MPHFNERSDLRLGRLSRRSVLRGAGGAALAALVGRAGAVRAADDPFAGVPLPPDRGQTDMQVYVPETGHTVRGTMLDYWRANGAAAVYGNPISEPFASADGVYSQAFECAVFQYSTEYVDTNDPYIRPASLGPGALLGRRGPLAASGRVVAGDRRVAAWQRLDPNGATVTGTVNAGGVFDTATGHTISGAFQRWYDAHEGQFYLGDPLSQPIADRGALVQYFAGAALMQADDGGVLALAPLVREQAAQLGIDTRPVSQGDLPTYSEDLFQNIGIQPSDSDLNDSGQAGDDYLQIVGDLAAPGRHWVEVSLGKQQLWAYQGDTVVMTTLVSTGLAPNLTAPGVFHVRYKFSKQTMDGFIGSTGEVTGLGKTRPADGGTYWVVPDIPNVMYFNTDAEALHGCYWHNNFGNPMSHGCVNLPLQVAAWMYGWAPLGTEVWIHD